MSTARIVNRGVDTLMVNAHYLDTHGQVTRREIDTPLYKQLEEWKKQAQEAGEPVPTKWVFQETHLLMRPNGAGRGHWQWVLISHLINISISRGKWNGGIAQVRFSSEYLWSCASLEEAIKQVHTFLAEHFANELFLQVSEVHLCVDVAGWDDIAEMDHRKRFVSRSRQRPGHDQADWNFEPGQDMLVDDFTFGLKRTGLSFSPKGVMSCVIYDKSRELKKTGKEWFEDKWLANGWEESERVWRVEFRFEREALHELQQAAMFHGIENVYDLPGKMPVLWAYGAGQVGGGIDGLPDGWLRCVVPDQGKNRSRWPVHPVWVVIQGAFQGACETPERFGEVVRKRHYDHNIRRGVEAMVGYATSLASWVGGELADPDADFTVFLHWLAIYGQKYLNEKDLSFGAEVQRKLLSYGHSEELAD